MNGFHNSGVLFFLSRHSNLSQMNECTWKVLKATRPICTSNREIADATDVLQSSLTAMFAKRGLIVAGSNGEDWALPKAGGIGVSSVEPLPRLMSGSRLQTGRIPHAGGSQTK